MTKPGKRVPVNTAAQANLDPLGQLRAASALGSSGAIEAQEVAGQQSFVDSDTLPAELRGGEKVLRRLGREVG